MSIIAGRDREIAEWVTDRIPHFEMSVTPYIALGWFDETSGLVTAGVVYENYTRINIDVHIATLPGYPWLNATFIRECFRYPFAQLGVKRVTGKTPASNEASRRFQRALGFKLEGVVREALPGGENLCIYGMLKDECRWLEVGYGQRLSAAGA